MIPYLGVTFIIDEIHVSLQAYERKRMARPFLSTVQVEYALKEGELKCLVVLLEIRHIKWNYYMKWFQFWSSLKI